MNETPSQAQQQRQQEQAQAHDLYVQCISKQLEEVDLLSSIYCTPGEMHIFDPSVISDFHDFLQTPNANASAALKAHLDYTIALSVASTPGGGVGTQTKLDVRIELPHLYPLLEHAIVKVYSALLSKPKETQLNREIEKFIDTMDKMECYVFQVVSWLQDEIPALIARDISVPNVPAAVSSAGAAACERLWIYSHHIKSKKKRHEILRQGRALDLSGFCRPGKPGIICVEGLREHTQEFWRLVKAMNWHKISVCKSETWQGELACKRRFEGFREQLFCDDLAQQEEGVMNMALFLKYLEQHQSGYMKKELFGLG